MEKGMIRDLIKRLILSGFVVILYFYQVYRDIKNTVWTAKEENELKMALPLVAGARGERGLSKTWWGEQILWQTKRRGHNWVLKLVFPLLACYIFSAWFETGIKLLNILKNEA